MKKILKRLFLLLLLFCSFSMPINKSYAESKTVYLGGMPIGFSIAQRGAEVVGISDVLTESGVVSPSKESGIKVGDLILYVGGLEVNNAKDLAVAIIDGKEKKVEVKRHGENILFNILPVRDVYGQYKLGLFVREEINGIGTTTFLTERAFASLGHPILNDKGEILELKRGDVYNSYISSIKKGERGCPGELHGVFISKAPIGKIKHNTNVGVFGEFNCKINTENLTKIEVGEGKIGNACIYSTIDGKDPKEYKISIVKVDAVGSSTKNFVIKIEDEELIDKTNGIVQGMSGSPIVQDGKLVGAVTHVFVNDPTRGFGVSINNMMNVFNSDI